MTQGETSLTALLGHCQDQTEGRKISQAPQSSSLRIMALESPYCASKGPSLLQVPHPPPHLVWLPEKNTPLLWLAQECWPFLHVETQSLDAGPAGLSLSVSSGAEHMNGCLQSASFESYRSETKPPSLAAFFSRRLDTPGFSEGLCRYRQAPLPECWHCLGRVLAVCIPLSCSYPWISQAQ